jgi:hypothetical protein
VRTLPFHQASGSIFAARLHDITQEKKVHVPQ